MGGSLEEQPHPPRMLGCPPVPPSLGTFPELIKPQGLCTLQDTFGLAGEGDSPGGIRIFGTQPWVGVRTLPAWMAG